MKDISKKIVKHKNIILIIGLLLIIPALIGMYKTKINYKNGVLERIRTSDTHLRRMVLYPTELRGHIIN